MGFVELLKAYYNPSKTQTDKFTAFLDATVLSKKKGMSTLGGYFYENPLNFSETGDKVFYFMLIHAELVKVIKTGKTGLMLEIDQTASGVMFLSYLLRNKKMAEKSNALGGAQSCPYTYCMDKFKHFYDNKMITGNEEAFRFLSSNRKLHKYALMCYCYAQTHVGRIYDFNEHWFSSFGRNPSVEERKVLKEFAVSYGDFINHVFPGTMKQLQVIYKVVGMVGDDLGYLPFKNLQGETFLWTFYKHKKTSRSSYDPISSKVKPYNSYKFHEVQFAVDSQLESEEGGFNKRLVRDSTTFRRKCLSYFIHCIDASMMHRFIHDMRDKHGYTINHLHDCVMLHPNFVGHFFDEVRVIYSTEELYDVSDDLLFNHISNLVSTDTKLKICKEVEKFKQSSDNYRESVKNANPKHIYHYEK